MSALSIEDRFQKTMMALAERVGGWPFFRAVQRGLALVLPLVLVGAAVLMVRYFPLSVFQDGMDAAFGRGWRSVCDNMVAGTLGIASLAVLCAFSGTLTSLHNQAHRGPFVSPVMAAVTVLACFFIVTSPAETDSWRVAFSMNRGLLVALVVAVLGSTLFLRLSRISWLRLPFRTVGNDPMARDVLTVMPAAMATIFIFGAVRVGLTAVGLADLHGAVQTFMMVPLSEAGSGLGTAVGYVSLSQLFWFFGIHGPNLLFLFEENNLVPALAANMSALSAGADLPFIVTKSFVDAFVRIGGSGSTLCLIVAVFIRSRDGGVRKLCLFALLPAMCNVNEPLLFGIPLVFNPVYAIPFLVTPVVQTVLAYGATAIDLVPHTSAEMTWTTPVILGGYVATNSVSGALMQMVNLAVGIGIYLPFVRFADRLRENWGKRIMDDLLRFAEGFQLSDNGRKCLDLPGEVGRAAKALGEDLAEVQIRGRQLFLEYQPQVDATGRRVMGVEALLRWHHPAYGRVPPPVTVALAEDLGSIDRLGLFVLHEACLQRANWKGAVADDLVVAVNMSPRQLSNPSFDRQVMEILGATGVLPTQLELEITESLVVEPNKRVLGALRSLRDAGVRVAIDDFGMGHASLRYIREFPVDTVKIDRSLTLASSDNVNEHIVRSIVELSRSLQFTTVVEGIENQEQLSRFRSLGCGSFQGYFFSRPVSGANCLDFIKGLERGDGVAA